MPATPASRAEGFRHEIVEVLKTLNWGAEEDPVLGGIEAEEILLRLKRGPCPTMTEAGLEEAIATLVANRMAEARDDATYAWERGRVVGLRYTLTVLGKQYLLHQLERTGRIG